MALLAEGETIKATLEFRNTLKLQENFAPARLEIAKLYEADEEFRAALGNYRLVVDLEPENVEARLGIARLMLAANQIDEALTHSTSAFQIAPRDPAVLTMRAAVAIRLQNYMTARASAETALNIDPTSAEARMVLAILARFDGDEAGAEAIIEEGLRITPGEVALSLFKLRILEEEGRSQEFGNLLAELAELNPETTQFTEALARWQLQQGDIDGAEATLRSIAGSSHDDPAPALAVVSFLADQRGAAAAEAELRRLIETREDDFVFRARLAAIYDTTGRTEEAMAYLREVIAAEGDSEGGHAARTQLANYLLRQNRRDEAERLIEEVLSDDEGNVAALTLRARLRLAGDEPDLAIQDLRAALNEAPESPEILLLLSTAHARNGSTDLARERLAAAVRVSDFAPELTLRYAQILFGDGKPELAEDLILDSVRRNSANRALLTALARVRLSRQDWIGAEEAAAALREIDRGSGTSERILAEIRLAENRVSESIELLKQNLTRGDFNASSMSALVRAYVRQGDAAAAKSFLDGVLEANPKNAQALVLSAALNILEGDIEAGTRDYQAAIDAEPDNPIPYRALARFHQRNLARDEAETVIRAGLERVPQDAGLRLDLALLLELTGRQLEAIDEYEVLYAQTPGSTIVANNYASLLADYRGDPESIETAVKVAKRLRSAELPAFQDTYGWVMFLAGDMNRALPALKSAAEGLPDNSLVQFHLGAAYASIGKTDLAVASLEKAIALASETDPVTAAKAQAQLDLLSASANGGE